MSNSQKKVSNSVSLRTILAQATSKVPRTPHLVPRAPRDTSTPAINGSPRGASELNNASQSIEVRLDLVDLYFKHIHDKHHSIFHRPSIEETLQHGRLPEILLYAMMALGARFSEQPEFAATKPRHRGSNYAEKAAAMLDMTSISIETIQACILLGTIAFAGSKMEAEALYYSVATRLALLLDLPNRPTTTEIERQINLRVWWTLYMIDIWSSTGLHLPRQFGYSEHVPLPTEESHFLHLPQPSHSNLSPTAASIWGEMAHLAHIWAEIHEVNKASVAGLTSPTTLNSSVATLSAKLQNWSASLHPHLTCTQANLTRYAALGLGSAFAALHLGYHYYNEVLFYQFLSPDTYHPPVVSTAHFSASCKLHARHFCDLLYLCNSLPDCAPLYVMVGHMLVVTSTVYMHSLLFSAVEEDIAAARARLEHNFEILTRLQSYWVELDVSLSRLKAFHNACRISSEQSFRLDRWMLSFLLEHGVPVTEKFVVRDEAADGSDDVGERRVADTRVVLAPGEGMSDTSGSPHLTLQDWYHQTFVA